MKQEPEERGKVAVLVAVISELKLCEELLVCVSSFDFVCEFLLRERERESTCVSVMVFVFGYDSQVTGRWSERGRGAPYYQPFSLLDLDILFFGFLWPVGLS